MRLYCLVDAGGSRVLTSAHGSKARIQYPGSNYHVMSRKGAIAWVILGVGIIARAASNGSRPPLRKPKPEPGGQGADRESSLGGRVGLPYISLFAARPP
jgi:hypothetical protein